MAALCAATAIIAVVVPFAGRAVAAGHRPDGPAGLPLPAPGAARRDGRGRDRSPFLIAGIGGFMTVVNCAYIGGLDRHHQTPRPRYADRHRGRGGRRASFSASSIIAALTVLVAAAAPDLRVDDRQRRRHRRDHRSHPRTCDRAAEQLKSDFATALHYWPLLILGYVDARHHVRHPDRVVGAVAGAGTAASASPTSTSWTRRPTPARSHRYRCGCTTSGSAIPAPTTTRSAR